MKRNVEPTPPSPIFLVRFGAWIIPVSAFVSMVIVSGSEFEEVDFTINIDYLIPPSVMLSIPLAVLTIIAFSFYVLSKNFAINKIVQHVVFFLLFLASLYLGHYCVYASNF